jgi:hypothetical protein
VSGLLATVALRYVSQDLIPASGDQDHTISPSASAALVSRADTSTAPAPRFVTIAIRPPEGRDGKSYSSIFISVKAKYFSRDGLTGILKISSSGKSVWRNLMKCLPFCSRSQVPEDLIEDATGCSSEERHTACRAAFA